MLLLLCYFDVIPRFLYVTILQLYKLIPGFEFFQNPAIEKSKSKKLEKALKYKTIGHKKTLHLNRNGSDYKVFSDVFSQQFRTFGIVIPQLLGFRQLQI